jgi:hypothetical protein
MLYSTAPQSTCTFYIARGLVFAPVLPCFLQYLTVYSPRAKINGNVDVSVLSTSSCPIGDEGRGGASP